MPPTITAPTTPINPSVAVIAGLAPRPRSTPASWAPSLSWRPITWPTINNAASAAIPPNTASAIASGSMARSALATCVEVTDVTTAVGIALAISDSTALEITVAMGELQPGGEPIGAATLGQPAGDCRAEEHIRR